VNRDQLARKSIYKFDTLKSGLKFLDSFFSLHFITDDIIK
jgi:hypothetical protein